jgi:hypothetical protein
MNFYYNKFFLTATPTTPDLLELYYSGGAFYWIPKPRYLRKTPLKLVKMGMIQLLSENPISIHG